MELLSPAGNREALVAAIACGADAVYLGYTAFGAAATRGISMRMGFETLWPMRTNEGRKSM